MLKIFDITDSITINMNKKDEERIYKLQSQSNELFKSSNNYILYFEKDKEKIEKYFGIKIHHDIPIIKYIEYFKGKNFLYTAYYNNNQEIDTDKYIDKIIKNIDKYEQRLFNSKNFNNEIRIIIKEQITKVFGNNINTTVKINEQWK